MKLKREVQEDMRAEYFAPALSPLIQCHDFAGQRFQYPHHAGLAMYPSMGQQLQALTPQPIISYQVPYHMAATNPRFY
ncbi:unnamed protein product [Gadus morhua 'NCC']|jgi:hypothetical protein